MFSRNDIVLAVDYHDKNLVVSRFNCRTSETRNSKQPTTSEDINQIVNDSLAEADSGGGHLIWIMESTTGWARVKNLLGDRAEMVLANVLQMPLPPKAYRRKTDKTDTARLMREYLNGSLPKAYQPSASLRQIRRVVAARESLVSRRTAVRNWTNRYLAHETWHDRTGLWSAKGMRWLIDFASTLERTDQVVLRQKLSELKYLDASLDLIEGEIRNIYEAWPDAQRVDEIYGIAFISATSILARIGSVDRFSRPEELISFAGLAPRVRQSDQTCHAGHIGGGGTDKHLRHYIIEATIWARKIPRYRPTYERAEKRRGKKIARLVVGRLLLRSIYKMLRDGVNFDCLPKT